MPELLPYQRAGVDFLRQHGKTFLADDMGLGKTAQAVTAVREERAYPALVVCPSYLRKNWVREIGVWDPGAEVLNFSPGMSNLDLLSVEQWVVMSYEALVEMAAQLEHVLRPRTAVFDECHYLKSGDTLRTRAAVGAASKAEFRFLLSGTPVLNRPKELWAQLEVLGVQDRFLGGDWILFKQQFCLGGKKSPWDQAEHAKRLELLSNMADYHRVFIRRTKQQVLPELPPLRRAYVPVDLDDRAAYLRAAEAAGDGVGRSDLLRQAAARGKMKQVNAWIDDFLETGRPLVVFAYHRDVAEAVARHCGVEALTGEIFPARRQQHVDDFQDGRSNVIVFTLHAGQLGYTLTRAADILFVQEDWVPALVDQAAARCHRIGQLAPVVTEWHLVATGTIEEDMLGLLDRKEFEVSGVIDGAATAGTARKEFARSLDR